MGAPETSEISVEEIMRRIREEVCRRKRQLKKAEEGESSSPPFDLPPFSEIRFELESFALPSEPLDISRNVYRLEEFLRYHDREFIINAYRGILKRDPDPEGFEHYLQNLRSGQMSKVEILGRLRFSPEGKGKGVKIEGLIVPLALALSYKVPVIGYFSRLFVGIANLPTIIKNFERFEVAQYFRWQEFQDRLHRNQERIISFFNAGEERSRAYWEALNQKIHHLTQKLEAHPSQEELEERFEGLHTRLEEALSSLTYLKEAHQSLQQALESKAPREELTQNISSLAQQIQNLQQALESKAPREELTQNISFLAQQIQNLQQALESKAPREELTQNISSLAQQIQNLQQALESKAPREELTQNISSLAQQIQNLQQALESKVPREELTQNISSLAQQIQNLQQALESKAPREELTQNISSLVKQIWNHKRHLVDVERRLLILLEEARKRLPEPFSETQLKEMVKEEDHFLDALYFSLEDRFRGTREDIKDRLRVYLPYVKEVLQKLDGGLVLDIGCGRGEWLELLKDEGIEALGVDINRVMIDQCQELGLKVIEGDALDYLRGQKNNTFSIITGFHIVEHLPLKKMLAIFDECLRTLKPGGMVIFETPNPENILVGACYFYIDPTHKNPIPPETLKFLIEERGFVKGDIKRLHERKHLQYQSKYNENVNEILYRINMEQDYAIIAYKA